jgi:Predicted metal-dependent hydrolase with the TIM-barrel fold
VSSASDYPVINPAYPLVGMQKGVIRQLPGRLETLHNPGERVTIEQMIEATTINEAYQLLCDNRLGSITVGKEADLVVLGTDIHAARSTFRTLPCLAPWLAVNGSTPVSNM